MTDNEKRAAELALKVCDYCTDEKRAIIARALDEAEERGRLTMARQYLDMNGKVPPPGHILDPDGVVRKVLGTLPLTADGCVLGECAKVWCGCGGGHVGECDSGKSVAFLDGANGEEAIVPREECYSTREAAEAARGAR